MVATTMPSTTSLLSSLRRAYPEIIYRQDSTTAWHPNSQTVTYNESEPNIEAQLLHETAHAISQHVNYQRDVELLGYERDAWRIAQKELGPHFGIEISNDTAQDHLDSYRDWLHARSKCPSCESTGVEDPARQYTCLDCSHEWRVNEARSCGLKRYNKK